MKTVADVLGQTSMVCANHGDGLTLRAVMDDWFRFLGGRPAQVVLLDNGSDEQTRRESFHAFEQGLVDKLVLVKKSVETGKDYAHIAEHTAPAIADRPYLLFFKMDCLPYRAGHDDWLAQAAEHLERADTFAYGGSFNVPSKHHDAMPGHYFSHKCSENFAFMKRERFIDSMQEFAGAYIASGFRGDNPGDQTGQGRYLVELAWEQYIQRHQCYTLVKTEDESWTVFHTNVHGEQLRQTRDRYFRREDVTRYMNAGHVVALHGGCYYGKPRDWLKELRVAFGASPLGGVWRAIKRMAGQ